MIKYKKILMIHRNICCAESSHKDGHTLVFKEAKTTIATELVTGVSDLGVLFKANTETSNQEANLG